MLVSDYLFRGVVCRTVKPFDKVVDSVLAGVTGLAYLRNGATEFKALFTLDACRKLYASLCDAISSGYRKVRIVVGAAVDKSEAM